MFSQVSLSLFVAPFSFVSFLCFFLRCHMFIVKQIFASFVSFRFVLFFVFIHYDWALTRPLLLKFFQAGEIKEGNEKFKDFIIIALTKPPQRYQA